MVLSLGKVRYDQQLFTFQKHVKTLRKAKQLLRKDDRLGPAPVSQVAVVGAGVAGLAAAASLSEAGFQVVLLEAANYIGGRVKQAQPFDGFPPVDLGGEFVHGADSIVTKLAKENDWKVKPGYDLDLEDMMVHLNGQLYPWKPDQPDVRVAIEAWDEITYIGGKKYHEEQRKVRTAMDDLVKRGLVEQHDLSRDESAQGQTYNPSMNQPGFHGSHSQKTTTELWSSEKYSNSTDLCVYDWLVDHHYSTQTIDIINARQGQNWGCSLKELGVCESGWEEDSWDYGSGNFRLEGSYSQLVKHYLDHCELVDKRLNWQVKEIIWRGERSEDDKSGNKSQRIVSIKNQHGESLEAKYVVITVPLTVLKDGDIRFVPSLPPNKQIAISSIHMGGALKIVCRVRKQFWPESVRLVFSVRGFIGQIWFYSRDPELHAAELQGEKCHVVTGFATDDWADEVGEMEEGEVCRRFIQQLNEIFGSESDPTPASSNFINYVYYHWNKNPYIRGGYSSPTAHACGMREELARPLDDCVFFAGEATNENASATVQSAIETGMRAAGEVCQVAGRWNVTKL